MLSPRQSPPGDLEDDLERWEAGTLSLDEVRSRHPELDVDAITNMHATLAAAGRERPPDPDRIWRRIERRIGADRLRRAGWIVAVLAGVAVAAALTTLRRRGRP